MRHYMSKEYMQVVDECFDIRDNKTRGVLLNIDEAEQGSILYNLTNKLYKKIVGRVTDIDFGTIPASRGNVDNVPEMASVMESLDIMLKLVEEYHQDPAAIRTVITSLQVLRKHKEQFMRGFNMKKEMSMMTYNSIVLSTISATSFLISTVVEYVKTPEGTYKATLDKMAIKKTKKNLIIKNLEKFNMAAAKGELSKTLNFITGNESVTEAFGITIAKFLPIIAGLILVIFPILKEIVYFFFHFKAKTQEFLDNQADLLQLNAYNLESDDTLDPVKKEKIIAKQLKTVEKLRKQANKFSIEEKQAEVKTEKDVKSEDSKLKIDDVIEQLPDSVAAETPVSGGYSLF